ncbi:MAG: hypothetical protein A2669_02000 [Candidatus Yanofskybacteria bacterium RIFCSPHIGHO2_01_FULL_48_25b]|uniref:histidine kinase n=1 Tax=Candidatus Yanofskybacteria bacterium RIFCSPHIGHO2_01_FULL_48_25b TaxID=1802672 RepID=A0A1F8F5D6_9BACT|nr:MAG: hypothetical protein A2669_02000 [Candidatus Yanofskybacteria bacterium RIFCSPHIGHO2_01_FULL_48_25b]
MKNFWRPFAAWVTELKNDPFTRARLKLTALTTLSILIVFLVAHLTLLKSNLTPLNFYLLIVICIATASFLISAKTLSPIIQIMRAQKRFISDASHELRTPLAIMKTNSEVALLSGDQISPQEATSTLKSNLEEVDRMSKIIENLLALSYYDNKFKEIPFQQINLSKVVINIVKDTENLARKKNIHLRLLNTDPGIIMGNPVAIEQMAINLIKNAVTYTLEGGLVSISVTARIATLEFKVKDTGIGIEKKDLPNVFNPFYKAGLGRIQLERESSGLGLTIVKKIVDRHHGSIYINSAIQKGTTIIVTLPRAQAEIGN